MAATRDVALELGRGADAGNVRVRWDDQDVVQDLYSPSPGSTTLQLDGARRWRGRLYAGRPESFWLQLRQGIVEGTLVRLRIGGSEPQEWTAGALAALVARDQRVRHRVTPNGVTFTVDAPEISIAGLQPWYRSSRGDRRPRLLLLWSATTALFAAVGSLFGLHLPRAALATALRYRLVQAAILLGVNATALALLVFGLERYLRWSDPFLHRVPFDSAHHFEQLPYYGYLDVEQGTIVAPWGGSEWYTWGHFVVNNRQGFRDRELTTPRPEDTCRVLVLGDSFTWGQGLAVEERYVGVAESLLQRSVSAPRIELVSLARPGAATVQERDFLRDNRATVDPDLIVVGYASNDPQPMGYLTAEERRFYVRYGPSLDRISEGLIRACFPQVARQTRTALYESAVAGGLVPHWEVGLDHTYDERSPEWQAFAERSWTSRGCPTRCGFPPRSSWCSTTPSTPTTRPASTLLTTGCRGTCAGTTRRRAWPRAWASARTTTSRSSWPCSPPSWR